MNDHRDQCSRIWLTALVAVCLEIVPLCLARADTWQVILQSADTLTGVSILEVSGDSLHLGWGGTDRWIPIMDLSEVRLVRDSHVWETAGTSAMYAGAVAACVAGVAIAISAHSSPILGSFQPSDASVKILGSVFGAIFYGGTFALIGGMIGGTVALIEDGDDVYDLANMNLTQRRYILQTLTHSP